MYFLWARRPHLPCERSLDRACSNSSVIGRSHISLSVERSGGGRGDPHALQIPSVSTHAWLSDWSIVSCFRPQQPMTAYSPKFAAVRYKRVCWLLLCEFRGFPPFIGCPLLMDSGVTHICDCRDAHHHLSELDGVAGASPLRPFGIQNFFDIPLSVYCRWMILCISLTGASFSVDRRYAMSSE